MNTNTAPAEDEVMQAARASADETLAAMPSDEPLTIQRVRTALCLAFVQGAMFCNRRHMARTDELIRKLGAPT